MDISEISETERAAEFEDCFPDLLRVALGAARRILGGGAVAEDVAAEALARLWLRWNRLGQADHRDAWLVRVATNLALDHVRRRTPTVADRDPAPDAADAVVVRHSVALALARLPRRQREVLALRHLHDLSVVETAEALGISVNSVKRHQQRGFAALRSDQAEELRDAF
jgi:RNA polymerase sigma factor (sigma-70 family)